MSLQRVWELKGQLARIPGAYAAYRWATKRRGEGRIYKVRVGPLRGLRWRRYNSLPWWYHLGLWEPHTAELIQCHLRPGDVFWDIWANAGYHTLVASRTVGPRGRVIAIEADPMVAEMLTEQLGLNSITNCEVVQAAVAGRSGEAMFTRLTNNLMSGLSSAVSGGEMLSVPAVTLDELMDHYGHPHLIKMDIEGGELEALPGGKRVFGQARPRWLLSTHGEEIRAFCRSFLRTHRYFEEPVSRFDQMIAAVPEEQQSRRSSG